MTYRSMEILKISFEPEPGFVTRSHWGPGDDDWYTICSVLPGEDLSTVEIDTTNLGMEIPVIPNIDAAILKALRVPGNSLDMDTWHTCETSHCRAGWAIHLAGGPGYALAQRIGTDIAATLIYAASGSHPTPNWHESYMKSMRDMRRRAGEPL